MSWTATLICAGLALATALFCGWRGASPPNLSKGPRLFPYRFVMLLSVAILALMVVHMGGLAGMLPPAPTYPSGQISG